MNDGYLGRHLLIELHDCDSKILDSASDLRLIMLEAVRRSGARIITDVFHQFSPQGVTGVVVIAESHVAIHTWPEHGYAAVDAFTCSDRMKPEEIFRFLEDRLACKKLSVQEVGRGQVAMSAVMESIL